MKLQLFERQTFQPAHTFIRKLAITGLFATFLQRPQFVAAVYSDQRTVGRHLNGYRKHQVRPSLNARIGCSPVVYQRMQRSAVGSGSRGAVGKLDCHRKHDFEAGKPLLTMPRRAVVAEGTFTFGAQGPQLLIVIYRNDFTVL